MRLKLGRNVAMRVLDKEHFVRCVSGISGVAIDQASIDSKLLATFLGEPGCLLLVVQVSENGSVSLSTSVTKPLVGEEWVCEVPTAGLEP